MFLCYGFHFFDSVFRLIFGLVCDFFHGFYSIGSRFLHSFYGLYCGSFHFLGHHFAGGDHIGHSASGRLGRDCGCFRCLRHVCFPRCLMVEY